MHMKYTHNYTNTKGPTFRNMNWSSCWSSAELWIAYSSGYSHRLEPDTFQLLPPLLLLLLAMLVL